MLDTFRQAQAVPIARMSSKILYLSSMDAYNGYHSIPLEEDSKNYFTFITEW
jgi:hypothetical protein